MFIENEKMKKAILKRIGEVIKKGSFWGNRNYTHRHYYSYKGLEVVVAPTYMSLFNKTKAVNPLMEDYHKGVTFNFRSGNILFI